MKIAASQAEKWWAFADVNNDGVLNINELKMAVNKCQVDADEPEFDDQQLCSMFISITGSTDSETISKELYMEQMGMDRSADLKQLFTELDVSGDGSLTYDEIKQLVQTQGLTEKAGQEIIKAADPNGDGKVTLQEFLKCVE